MEEDYVDPQFLCPQKNMRSLLEELRGRVQDALPSTYDTDFNLARWLIGWDYDMEEAEGRLRKHLRMRKLLGLDRAQLEVHPVLQQHYPNCHLETQAHDGSLVYVMLFSLADTQGLLRAVDVVQFYRSRLSVLENLLRRLTQLERKTGARCSVTYVIDLEGLRLDSNLLAATRGPFAYMTRLMQENYVELIKRVLVVNEGSIIHTLFSLLTPLIPASTRRKVKLLGPHWKTEILKYCPASSLPRRWGGTLDEEDKVVVPSRVPESLYWSPGKEGLPRLSPLEIGRASRGQLEFDFTGRQGRLSWTVFINGEVTFGVYRLREGEEEGQDLAYPEFLVVAEHVPLRDEITCKDAVYCARFTNDSWIFSKTVRHNFSLSFDN